MRARSPFILVLAAWLLAAPGCSREPQTATGEPGAAPARGGTVRVGILKEPATFVDWYPTITSVDVMAQHLVFRRLFRPGAEPGEFVPDLAASWELADGGRTLEVSLRDGFEWEDGRPVAAEDVVASIRRGARVGSADAGVPLESVESPAPHRVFFRFRRPYPEMLDDVARYHVYPAHLMAEVSEEALLSHPFNREPVGSGPFRLEAWEPGQYLAFSAREAQPDAPAIDRVVLRIFSDKEAALRELEGEGIDVMFRVPHEHAERLESAGMTVHRFARPSQLFLCWNAALAPWDRAEVRRAMTRYLDRQALAASLGGSAESVARGPVATDHPWYEPLPTLPVTADREGASRSLEAAGWKRSSAGEWLDASGARVELELVFLQGPSEYRNAATVVADELRRNGVGIELKGVELASFRARMGSGEFEAMLIGLGGKVDLGRRFGSGGKENFGGFSDPELDAILARYDGATDEAAAREAFTAARQRIIDRQPWTFLYYRAGVIAARPGLRGVEASLRDPLSMADRWWLEPAR